ncbi:MAG: threonine transporter RhtB [Rhodobacteraceae bacterium]|nr:threonine transporter RhtB [Paracoccaceae bacterium]
MIDTVTLIAFVPAALALNLTPGADMMFCAAQGLKGGARAGWLASAGVAVGGMTHGLLAGLGLAALIAAHPALFEIIRWVGVAYLLRLAWGALRQTGAAGPQAQARAAHPFRDALLVNLSNPKVILFNLAFVPQFTDPAQPILPQFLTFAAILCTGGLLVNGLAGAVAGVAKGRVGGRLSRWPGRISAVVFSALAIRLILQERA